MRQQDFVVDVHRAIADLEGQLAAVRRRERRTLALVVIAGIVAVNGWAPLVGQGQKTIEERITDLEKRGGGVVVEDGITRLTAPLEIYDLKGQMIAAFTAHENGGLLAVGGGANGYVGLGSGAHGGIIRVHGIDRKTSVAIGSPLGVRGRGVFVMGDGGSRAEAALTIDNDQQPNLELGDLSGGGVRVRVNDADGGGLMSFRDHAGDPRFIIGSLPKLRYGLYAFGDAGQPAVSLYADQLGGNVRVHSPQGMPVGGLFSEEEGGGMVLTGPQGGSSVVDLGIRNDGGSVRVFSVGGSPTRAALEADAKTGGVTAFNDTGRVAATMTSRAGGSGYFQLMYNGVTMVDAGMNEDEVGIVRAGPSSQKTVGVLSIPYRLVGRK